MPPQQILHDNVDLLGLEPILALRLQPVVGRRQALYLAAFYRQHDRGRPFIARDDSELGPENIIEDERINRIGGATRGCPENGNLVERILDALNWRRVRDECDVRISREPTDPVELRSPEFRLGHP